MGEPGQGSGSGPSSHLPPDPPEGYGQPHRFEYSSPVLLVLSLPMFLVAAAGFGAVLLLVHGPAVVTSVVEVSTVDGGTTVAVDLVEVGAPFLTGLAITVIGHELLHGAVMSYFGQDVTYGVNPAMGAVYASAFGQFQRRRDLFAIGLAPLVGLTLLATPLLLVPVPVVALTAYVILVTNATGAAGDLYVLWRLWRLPPGTLMYDADLRHWYVFEPLESAGGAA
jgi:hypothetical protein